MIDRNIEKAIDRINRRSDQKISDLLYNLNNVLDEVYSDEETIDHTIELLGRIETIVNKAEKYVDQVVDDYDSRNVIEDCESLYGIDEDTVNKVSKEIYHQIIKGMRF